MNKTGIKIDRLNLSFKGVSSVVARDLISGLGIELMRNLSDQRDVLKGKRSGNLDSLDSGKLKVSGDTSPTELRRMTAERIISAIISKAKT